MSYEAQAQHAFACLDNITVNCLEFECKASNSEDVTKHLSENREHAWALVDNVGCCQLASEDCCRLVYLKLREDIYVYIQVPFNTEI